MHKIQGPRGGEDPDIERMEAILRETIRRGGQALLWVMALRRVANETEALYRGKFGCPPRPTGVSRHLSVRDPDPKDFQK